MYMYDQLWHGGLLLVLSRSVSRSYAGVWWWAVKGLHVSQYDHGLSRDYV